MSDSRPRVLILGHSFVSRLQNAIHHGPLSSCTRPTFDLDKCCEICMYGVGGRTIEKLQRLDMGVVGRFQPDVLILEIGTNDLSHTRPETVGSDIESFIQLVRRQFGVRVVGLCEVLNRKIRNQHFFDGAFNRQADLLRQYLHVVLSDMPGVFIWQHKSIILAEPELCLLSRDGVHLSDHGEYRLYRSYRGAILKALKLLSPV